MKFALVAGVPLELSLQSTLLLLSGLFFQPRLGQGCAKPINLALG